MRNRKQEHQPVPAEDSFYHAEDLAMKSAACFFGEELLQYLNIPLKATAVMPTEIVRLEAKQLYEDFNFQMEDGTWYHFEFESDRITTSDLKRFREYEAATSRTYQVPVVTCVVCSAGVKKVVSELTEGLNTYRIRVFQLKKDSADRIFREAGFRQEEGRLLKKEDLIPVVLSPLMSGKMTQKERALNGFRILREAEEQIDKDDMKRLQAMLYVLAGKFLGSDDLQQVKEAMAMNALGEMLIRDGMERGIEKGMEKGMEKGIEKGEQRVNRLIQLLIEHSRSDEIAEAVKNKEFQEKLFREYGL